MLVPLTDCIKFSHADTVEELKLRSRVVELEDLVQQGVLILTKEYANVNSFQDSLIAADGGRTTQYTQLLQEYEQLCRDEQNKTAFKQSSVDPDITVEFRPRNDEGFSQTTVAKPKTTVNAQQRAAKKLYLRISKLTHPDKVDNPILNELFIDAQRAYAAYNVHDLSEIYECVLMRKSWTATKLRTRLIDLEKQLNELPTKWFQLKTNPMYHLYVRRASMSDPDLQKLFNQSVDAAIANIKAMIHLHKNPPTQVFSYATSATWGTTSTSANFGYMV